MSKKILLALVLAVFASSCESEADRQRERERLAAEVLRQETEKKEAAKQDVMRNPARYLETSDIGYYDKGIINSYRQVISVSVMNSSQFPVKDLEANVEWFDAKDGLVGSTPVKLKGSIPAGGTKKFSTADGSMTSGTIQGAGKTVKFKWSNVEVVESKR